MERLTKTNYRNLDPWECCGQDDYCQRKCHEKGGCANGCDVPKLYARLAAYEDTGLMPYEIKSAFTPDASIKLAAQALGTTPERLRELAAADKDGRVLVMPCKFGDKLYRVFGEEIQEFTVSNIKYMGLQHRWSVDTTPFILYAENLIGTELFLTREEAERSMEGRKNG